MPTSEELAVELAKVRKELKAVQEELIIESGRRNRLEGELEGFQKCFKLINNMGPPDEEEDDTLN